MTGVIEIEPGFLRSWQSEAVREAIGRMIGGIPSRIELARTHFPGSRPVQMVLSAHRPDGHVRTILAEHVPHDPAGHADRVRASLSKSRNGQKQGLLPGAVVVPDGSGLVLRRPGLDERLPGLRLLHDPGFGREVLSEVLGQDPGPVLAELAAHRLGKRAVLRMSFSGGAVYVRLRPIKSGLADPRLARHRALWSAVSDGAALGIPVPLGEVAGLGASAFSVLPGEPPDFGSAHGAAIARAIEAMQGLAPGGLPVHSGADEARLLLDWLDRCHRWRKDVAKRLEGPLAATIAQLAATSSALVPCHRDLHEKQILISGTGAGFLDFDTLCLSDPGLDPGNLLAHLFFAGIDEAPLRRRLDQPGIPLWRRAALFRLAMIQAFTFLPEHSLDRLIEEAISNAGH